MNEIAAEAQLAEHESNENFRLSYAYAKRHGVLVWNIEHEVHVSVKEGVDSLVLMELVRTLPMDAHFEVVTEEEFEEKISSFYQGGSDAMQAAADIGETLDQPQTTTSYYLHLRNYGTDTPPTRTPIFITDTLDVQTFSTITIKNLFKEWIRETASESTDGYKITYQAGTSGSGNTRGTAMVNTKLDGAGLYVTFEAYATDYRAQEFPNGSVQTIATYNLRINKE